MKLFVLLPRLLVKDFTRGSGMTSGISFVPHLLVLLPFLALVISVVLRMDGVKIVLSVNCNTLFGSGVVDASFRLVLYGRHAKNTLLLVSLLSVPAVVLMMSSLSIACILVLPMLPCCLSWLMLASLLGWWLLYQIAFVGVVLSHVLARSALSSSQLGSTSFRLSMLMLLML